MEEIRTEVPAKANEAAGEPMPDESLVMLEKIDYGADIATSIALNIKHTRITHPQ